MKILFVTDLYNIKNNGESVALNNFAEEWRKMGHEVVVIRPNFLPNTVLRQKKIFPQSVFFQNGIKIINLNFFSPFWFDVYNKLPADFDISSFDVLVSHMPSGTLFAKKLLNKVKIPFCASVHCSDMEVLSNPVYALYFRHELLNALKMCDILSPRSFCLEEKIEKFVAKPSFVAFSGIDKNIILSDCELKSKISKNSRYVITTVANLKKRKNVHVVLKTLARFKNLDFEYRIIGAGKEFERLKMLAFKSGLNEKVRFYGKLPHNEAITLLKESDIFVLLSQNETFGLVYLEALAAGNIVVATKNDGIDGIIRDGKNGFLSEVSIEELSKTFDKIFNLNFEGYSQILQNANRTILQYTKEFAAENYLDNLIKH